MIAVTETTSHTLSPSELEAYIAKGRYRRTDVGEIEKRCACCLDFWPADSEFFFRTTRNDGLHSYCKACYATKDVRRAGVAA